MSFPPPPADDIDWESLPFDISEVIGHVESHYTKATGQWSDPQFVKDPYLHIHGISPALHYGQQAFEGLKAFRFPSGSIHVFRPEKNALRMQRSGSYLSIPPVPEDRFLECVNMAVAGNASFVPPHGSGAALYIRPFIFGSSPTLSMASPDKYTFCVYTTPVGVAFGLDAIRALVLETFDRVAPEGTGRAKVGGNYSPLVKHINKAREEEGYGILLHLDSKNRTEIDEFSMSGFIGIRRHGHGRYTLVVPEARRTIESVTSDSVCEIARDQGWTVEIRTVKYDELKDFSEVLAVGTAGSLVPIKSVTRKSTGETFAYDTGEGGGPGPCCARLSVLLKGIQQGKIEDKFGWCREVTDFSVGFSL